MPSPPPKESFGPAPLPKGEGAYYSLLFSLVKVLSCTPQPLSQRERGAYYSLLFSIGKVLFLNPPAPLLRNKSFGPVGDCVFSKTLNQLM